MAVVVHPGRRKREDSRYADQAAQLAARLRALRENAKMTQMELAVRSDVSESTIRKIEQGKIIEPGFFTIIALLKALGTTLTALE